MITEHGAPTPLMGEGRQALFLCIAPVGSDHPFQRVSCRVDQVVPGVGITGDEVTVPVAVIFVVDKLLGGVRRAGFVDDNRPALQPLHAVVHAAAALGRGLRLQAEAAVVRHALWLRAVADDGERVVSLRADPRGGLLREAVGRGFFQVFQLLRR